MDLTVVSTYRCNSRCQMCYIWKNPTAPVEEVSLETLAKLPNGFDNLNISGGEPTLRKDLADMVDILYPKARTLEISSNGLRAGRLVPIIRKYPGIKVRFSLEGDEATNNSIRGEKDGFKLKLEGIQELKEAGGTDLGFALVIQDENIDQLMKVYELTQAMDLEFATSTLHNAWQFYKNDNYFYDRINVARKVEPLISAMLSSWDIKSWFRAYLNLGLIEKILGQDRLIPCVAGKEFAFIDPWSDVWACNVRTDLKMGNLKEQGWHEIIGSKESGTCINKVGQCTQNCWMVTTARTAIRSELLHQLPKIGPASWVIINKLRLMLGGIIPFGKYVDYGEIKDSPHIIRHSFLNSTDKPVLSTNRHTVDDHYPLKVFINE